MPVNLKGGGLGNSTWKVETVDGYVHVTVVGYGALHTIAMSGMQASEFARSLVRADEVLTREANVEEEDLERRSPQ